MSTAVWIIAICILLLTVREILTALVLAWAKSYVFVTPPTPVRYLFKVLAFVVRS